MKLAINPRRVFGTLLLTATAMSAMAQNGLGSKLPVDKAEAEASYERILNNPIMAKLIAFDEKLIGPARKEYYKAPTNLFTKDDPDTQKIAEFSRQWQILMRNKAAKRDKAGLSAVTNNPFGEQEILKIVQNGEPRDSLNMLSFTSSGSVTSGYWGAIRFWNILENNPTGVVNADINLDSALRYSDRLLDPGYIMEHLCSGPEVANLSISPDLKTVHKENFGAIMESMGVDNLSLKAVIRFYIVKLLSKKDVFPVTAAMREKLTRAFDPLYKDTKPTPVVSIAGIAGGPGGN